MSANDPSNKSSDYLQMAPYWKMVSDISGGVRTMREAGIQYLPKFPAEDADSYKRRRENARMTNVFSDVVENLARRPFQKPVMLTDTTSSELVEFAEDVNGQGDNLHTFTAKLFQQALIDGLTWLMVDYTRLTSNRSLSDAQAKISSVRPLWVHYLASEAYGVYTDRIDGLEQFVEARFYERSIERNGFEENAVERMRVFRRPKSEDGVYGPAQWMVYRKKEARMNAQKKTEWEVEEGPYDLGIENIPLIGIVFGNRKGNTWAVTPPMRDAAYLQIELYQQENGLKNVRTQTAFPMLAANGMSPKIGPDGAPMPIQAGPNVVLYGGESEGGGGNWNYIEPSATSLQFLREDVRDTIREIRELGRQPLTVQSGNLTVITTAVAAKKGNTAVQAWVGILTHDLENAFKITAQWMQIRNPRVGVAIYTDFDLGIGDDESFKYVLQLATGDNPLLSPQATLSEAQRR
ncbi:MAG: DUF4055 domain-containing protein, partial [Candidatus Dadabacteria bacterium]|nr:DUF4055 domain-containing protein [Candidatus Dadabacteria bacterium]